MAPTYTDPEAQMSVEAIPVQATASTNNTPKILAGVLAGCMVIGMIFALTAAGHQGAAQTPEAAVDTSMYTLAGFKITTTYKCIFPTCTDSWCNANCNHKPSYCPASFCRRVETKIPVPTAPPTEKPTAKVTAEPAAPTC